MDDRVRLTKMRADVAALYERNRQRGLAPWCGYEYDFVCPSTGTYPFQWFWDSCFHAIVLSHIDVRLAETEIRSLLKNQAEDGFVAHVTFWQREKFEEMLSTYAIAYRTPYLSDCIQPPVLGIAIQAIMDHGGSDAFLREVLPEVRRYFDWLDRVRDPDRDGLVATLQPDESGLDHTPKHDEYLGVRRNSVDDQNRVWHGPADAYEKVGRDPARMFAADVFVLEDVMVNTVYAESQRALAGLYRRIGDAAGAAEMDARARKTRDAIVAKCWDEEAGLFFDLAGLAERKLRVDTFTCLVPLMLPDLPEAMVARLVAAIEDPGRYATPYPLPTVSPREKGFSPFPVRGNLVFRGTTWINSNWLVTRGLRRHGREDLARRIEDASFALVDKSGFREHFNPFTGEGHGAEGFSWSGLVLDMLASRVA